MGDEQYNYWGFPARWNRLTNTVASVIVSFLLLITLTSFVPLNGGEEVVLSTSPQGYEKVHVSNEVWVLPITVEEHNLTSENNAHLLSAVNNAFSWFPKASDGRLAFTAKKVLPEQRIQPVPSGRWDYSDCSVIEDAVHEEASKAPRNVVVVAFTEMGWRCDYGGKAKVKGHWVIVTNWIPKTDLFPKDILIHELGHVLGLPHSKSFNCSILSKKAKPHTPTKCKTNEYGDYSDPMGGSRGSNPPGFNALNLKQLGWGTPPITLPNESGEYAVTLQPVSLNRAGTPDYLALPGNMFVSYRAATGSPLDPDSEFLPLRIYPSREGVYVYTLLANTDPQFTVPTPVVIPFTRDGQAGTVGDHYIAPDGTFGFRIDSVTRGREAKLTVVIAGNGERVRDQWGPRTRYATKKMHDGRTSIAWSALDPSGIKGYSLTVGHRSFSMPPKTTHKELNIPKGTKTVYLSSIDLQRNVTITTIKVE